MSATPDSGANGAPQNPPGAGPLAGVKVLELGTLIAGPFAARFLGEFGADVIKIEDPKGGDPLRKWRKLYPEVGGTSLWWAVQARNKKSVTINLKAEEGKEIVRRLAREADIVVENFRPGLLEKLGLGYDVLSAENPGLVMVRLSGYGQTGPYRDRPGFGAIAESMGGLRHITGYPELPPPRIGISIGDSIAALHGVIGALMALHHKQVNGGKGQVVDVALYEAVFNMMESVVPEYGVYGMVRERTGASLPGIVPSNTYPCRDGSIVIGGNSDPIFRRLMIAIEREDLANDPALAHNDGRVPRTRGNRRGDRRVARAAHHRRSARSAQCRRRAGGAHLQRGRYVHRSAVPRASDDSALQVAGRPRDHAARGHAEALGDAPAKRAGSAPNWVNIRMKSCSR